MSVLKIRDENGKVIEVACIKGDQGIKGEKGDPGEITENYAHKTFAPVIRNTVTGSAVAVSDMSPIEQELDIKLTSATVIDFSTITVNRWGKNIFTSQGRNETNFGAYANTTQRAIKENSIYVGLACNNYYQPYNIADYDTSNPQSIKINSRAVSEYGIGFNFRVNPDEVYTLSMGNFDSKKHELVLSFYTQGGGHISYVNLTEKGYVTAKAPQDAFWMMAILVSKVAGEDVFFKNVMLELASQPTQYEDCKKVQTAVAYKDGTVEGITGLYANTTLFTDDNEVLINLTYNADTKLYIDNKLSKI